MDYPQLLMEYLNFCKYRARHSTVGSEIPNFKLLTPTMALPLQDYFVNRISHRPELETSLDPHVITIPIDETKSRTYDDFKRTNNPENYGGENVLSYVIGELSDNIYQHSKFSYGLTLGRETLERGYCELAIFDDGITIAGSLEGSGMSFDESTEPIVRAINGLSSKDSDERGQGLGSIFRLLIRGLSSELFIASGSGAIFVDPMMRIRFSIIGRNRLGGTLISTRIPYPCPKIDIYDYL
jgi:hypothetical protein